jgi:hypothetical protein
MILCWLGIHKWGKWSEIQDWWVGTQFEGVFQKQSRGCSRCGLVETKYV